MGPRVSYLWGPMGPRGPGTWAPGHAPTGTLGTPKSKNYSLPRIPAPKGCSPCQQFCWKPSSAQASQTGACRFLFL